MGIAVTLPFLFPLTFSAKPSDRTLQFANALDGAIADSRPVGIELAFGNQTMAELEPITIAVLHRLFKQKKKVIIFTFYESSTAFIRRYLSQMEKTYHLKNGEDFAFLGYTSSFTAAIYKMGTSIREVFHEDDRGVAVSKLSIMKNIVSIKDLSAVIAIAGNSNPRFWINFAVVPFGIDLLAVVTAVEATNYFPFLQTGQLKGMIGGGRAGAEFEQLLVKQGILKTTGDATRSLGAQSLALLVIMAFIIIGNAGWFIGRMGGGDK
jgi:hypothetical protein